MRTNRRQRHIWATRHQTSFEILLLPGLYFVHTSTSAPSWTLRTHDALRLLHTSRNEFKNVEDPNSEWPFSTAKDQAIASAMKVRHLGWLLIRLKADLEAMASHSAQRNQHLQSQYFDDFSAIHTNPDAPVVPPNHINRTVKPPILGPLETETAVEPYNRCPMALKYLQHGLRSKKLYKRLADEPKKGKPSNASFTPEFMRPKPAPAKKIPTSQATTEADNLPDVQFNVNWNPKFNADDLEDELEERDSTGKKDPTLSNMSTRTHDCFPLCQLSETNYAASTRAPTCTCRFIA